MSTKWAITYFGQPRNCRAALEANRDKLPANADVFFHLWQPSSCDAALTSASRFAMAAPAAITADELLSLYKPREFAYQAQLPFSPNDHAHLAVALETIPAVRVMSMLHSLQQAVALASHREYTAVLALRTDVVLSKPWPGNALPSDREVLLSLDQGAVEPLSWERQNPAHLDFLAAGTPKSIVLYASCIARLGQLSGHWVPEFLLGDNLVDLGVNVGRVDLGPLTILR